ncbi:MAG: prolipoprotein diacylglyceryl transferase [Lachnospiraceae bacterium]|nr:prolipoprotein diacylglyceryl transferase [Lachnospiraceae bacterium]
MPADVSICFPHLGIALENLRKSFSVFGVEIAYYGVIIGIGMLVAMLLAFRDAKLSGQNVDDYVDLAIYGIIFAIVGARLYYVIFEWEYYSKHLSEIINLRNGGLAIYGGIIGGVLVCIVLAKRRKLSVWRMLDTGAIGLVTGQMIGRWGNFFNREAYGGDTDSLFAMRININDPLVSVNVQDGVSIIDNSYIQVHPTFLYESFWCLCILVFIQLFKRKKKFDGEVFLWYISAYGFGRFFIEGLRTDQLTMGNTGIAISQVLSALVLIAGVLLIIVNRVRIRKGMDTIFVGSTVKEDVIQKAMDFAKDAHQGQIWTLSDGSDISYFEGHLLGVYHLLAKIPAVNEEMLVTALLHDTMEDTKVGYSDILKKFNRDVAENVQWLTKKAESTYYDYIDELLQNGSDAAVIVKLADRQFNTENLMNLGDEEWHEKKIDQAKYILDKFRMRKVRKEYEGIKKQLLDAIETDVADLEENEKYQ